MRGLNRSMSIEDNLVALKFDLEPFTKHYTRNKKEVRKFAEDLIEKFDIRPKKADVITQSLSGGNAQKIVIAREVDAGGDLLRLQIQDLSGESAQIFEVWFPDLPFR